MAELIKSCHALSGTFTVTGYTTSSVPFTINMAAGQTANALEIKTSTGTPVYWITPGGDVHYIGDEYITDHLTVNGGATIGDTLSVTNLATVGSLVSTGNATVGGVLNVTGNSTFSSAVTIQNNLTVNGGFTTTGTVLFPNGTTAAPSISFTGDPDTGFYLASANVIGVSISGSQIMRIGSNVIYVNTLLTNGATTLTLQGQVGDGATAVAATIGSYSTYSTSGAKLLSVVNNTTEKAYVDKDGNIISGATGLGTINASMMYPSAAGNSLSLRGYATDGATAIGLKIGNAGALVTAGAKIASFYSDAGTTERAAVGYLGEFIAGSGTLTLPGFRFMADPDNGFFYNSTNNWRVVAGGTQILEFDASGVYVSGAGIIGSANSVTLSLTSYQIDGATNVGVTAKTATAWTTAGAKIMNFKNATVEKAFIDKDGRLSLGDSSPLYLYPQERTPEVCVAGTPSAGGSVTDGTHSYKVTFVTAEGESTPSAKSNVITCSGGNNTVALTGIAIGGARVTARKIYRTDAGDAGDWKLIATIANNTATTASDTEADAGGAAAPTVNTTTNLFVSTVANSATANGFVFNTAALSTAGANLLSAQNNGTEKWFVNKDGYSTGGSLLANSSGTVAIANDSADVLEANSGWLYIAATDGTVYRVPAWAI